MTTRIPSIEEIIDRHVASPPEPLPPGEVHLWIVRPPPAVDAELQRRLSRIIADSEQARMSLFRFPADAALHGVGRALARLALSTCAAVRPSDWRFRQTGSGRPEIEAPASGLRFNLSHTRDLVACVISTQDAGVDVECIDRGLPSDDLLRSVCDDAEREEIVSAPAEQRARMFYERWTLKEAYLKARGTGLGIAPKSVIFLVSGAGAGRSASLSAADDEEHASGWQFELISPTDEHVLSLAVRAPGHRSSVRVRL